MHYANGNLPPWLTGTEIEAAVCEQLGLLEGTHFSLDGVKLSANVSKEWSGTIEELKHKRDK